MSTIDFALPTTGPSSKFRPPGASGALVGRQAVTSLLERAGAAKLILVRAPAGFGKTMALRQVHDECEAKGIATSWMTLDAADNDAPRLLACLSEAVRRLQLPDSPAQNGVTDIVSLLSQEGSPFALFLDDFELLRSPASIAIIKQIVERLPRNGQLVVGSRNLPDLGVGRLRVRGHLMEVGVEMLRFSIEETCEFLTSRGVPPLAREMIEELHTRTEGWVAALQLVSMTLPRSQNVGQFITRLSGAGGPIAEYLAEDVLERQPEAVREFLLRTSILRRLIPELCQALVPQTDCAAMLEQLRASNLFLMPLEADEGEALYRYHALFAGFLRAQLRQKHPDELPRLHGQASAWHEAMSEPVPAIDHAIYGGDFPRALSLLTRHAQAFLEEGRMLLLARWFSLIPDASLAEHPFLQVVQVWATLFTEGAVEALQALEMHGFEMLDDPVIASHVNALRPLLLAMRDQYDEAHEEGKRRLQHLPTPVPFADAVLINCMAHVTSVQGDKTETRRLLLAARATHNTSLFNLMYTEATEGMLDLEQGRFRQAIARFRVSLNTASHDGGYSQLGGNAWAGILYAGALYDANELDLVERLLDACLPLARDVGLPDHMISGYTMRARLLFLRGDIDGGTQVLTELETLGHLRQLPRVVAGAKLERAKTLILQGDAAGARDELQRADNTLVWERVARQRLSAHELVDISITWLRWTVHFGDATEALAYVDEELPRLEAENRIRRSRKLRILKSMTLWRQKQHDASIEMMLGVAQEGSREGFLRLIADEGSLAAAPVSAILAQMKAGTIPSDPILFEYIQRLLEVFGPAAQADELLFESEDPDRPRLDIEPLTQKELGVLRLLAQGYSNSALSEKLFVSDSTIRTHLRNINSKLGAQNRTQAVFLGKRYGLIH